MFGKLLDTATYLKAKLQQDEMELALAEATTEDNWQASTTVLHEIASSSYDHQKWKRINTFLWDRLKNSKNWKKMLKCLNIVEFILKNGSEFGCNELKYELRFFRTLESFQLEEGTIDRGASIRERAQNEELLEDERLRSHQIRQKMSHLTGGSGAGQKPSQSGSIPKYESYNSETFHAPEQTKGYYNYGKGNYGDRYEDKKYDHDYFQNANRMNNAERQRPKSSVTVPDHQPAPIPVQPKVERVIPVAVSQSVRKPKPMFSSIAQHLAKPSRKVKAPVEEQVVRPDQSYKKKAQEQLIDLEEAFMENRYQFEAESPPVQPTVEQKRVVESPIKPTYTPTVPEPQPQSNPLMGFDSISFFGGPSVQEAPPAPAHQTVVQPNPHVIEAPLKAAPILPPQPIMQSKPSPTTYPQTNQAPVYNPYAQPQPQPQPQPQMNVPVSAPTYPGNYNANPGYGHSGGYNQFNTYNNYGSNYYNPGAANGYYPPPPPTTGLNYAQPPNYPSPPANYPVPPPSHTPYNPYANNANQISLGTPAPAVTEATVTPQKKPEKESVKPSSVNSLVDLSGMIEEISEDKKNSPKKSKPEGTLLSKAEHSNGIKIDLWAW